MNQKYSSRYELITGVWGNVPVPGCTVTFAAILYQICFSVNDMWDSMCHSMIYNIDQLFDNEIRCQLFILF